MQHFQFTLLSLDLDSKSIHANLGAEKRREVMDAYG